jgi:hypothetical protein
LLDDALEGPESPAFMAFPRLFAWARQHAERRRAIIAGARRGGQEQPHIRCRPFVRQNR